MGRLRQNYGLYSREYETSTGPRLVWWYWAYDDEGKRKRFSTGVEGLKKKSMARLHCENLLAAGKLIPLDEEKPIKTHGGPSTKAVTLREYSNDFWDWTGPRMTAVRLRKKITPGTAIDNLGKMENHILPTLGDMTLKSITPRIIESWMLNLTKKMSPKTANNILSVLRTVLREAVRLGDLKADPSFTIEAYQRDETPRDTLTPEEGLLILSHPDWWPSRELWAINLTAATTGARVGELIALTVDKVHLDRIDISATLRTYAGKDGKSAVVQGDTKTGKKGIRWIPLAPKVAKVLQELCVGREPGEYAFSGRDHLYVHAPARSLKAVLEFADKQEYIKLNGRNVVFHAWRHWFNSMMAGTLSGESLRSATGHRTEAMTDRYFHQMEHHIQEVARAQDKAFFELNK